jgi:tRNA A37 threonylcarbamoyladenosine dehydratase
MSGTRFDRVKALVSDEGFQKLQNAKIIIFGVGGVGGFCLDALYRSGVKDITIVDFDTYDITNQNRQIGSNNVGQIKVEVLSKIYKGITPINVKVTPQWVEKFDFDKFDVVCDAIDDIPAKVALANKTSDKLVGSCGGAKRFDPTKIQTTSIWKTSVDPFAKKFRYELKKSGFKKDFEVVFSTETAQNIPQLGSLVQVTGSFGFALASLVFKKINHPFL